MINEEEKRSIAFRVITDRDDENKPYKKSIYYMCDSIRLSIKTFADILRCTKSAQMIYWVIINKLNKNQYEIRIDRATFKVSTGLSDASVSLAIKELKEKGLIYIIEKDTYHLPIHQCVKGNVNTIIEQNKKKEEELALIAQEKANSDQLGEYFLELGNKKK